MVKASLPHNEAERFLLLRWYDLLYMLPERDFDDLAPLASPNPVRYTAWIALINAKCHWFKAVRLRLTHPFREMVLCGNAIQSSIVARSGQPKGVRYVGIAKDYRRRFLARDSRER